MTDQLTLQPLLAYKPRDEMLRNLLFPLIGGLLGLACVTIAMALAEADHMSPRTAKLWFGFERDDASLSSIQTMLWVAFGVGLAELASRVLSTWREASYLAGGPIPGKPGTLIKLTDIKALYRTVKDTQTSFVSARLILQALVSFRVSGSVTQAANVVQAMSNLMFDQLGLRYNLIRYILWVLPSLGFIGTVLGISQGLEVLAASPPTTETAPEVLGNLTGALSVAFDTTLVALVLSVILALLTHVVETREEQLMSTISQYLTDHLINRLSNPLKGDMT